MGFIVKGLRTEPEFLIDTAAINKKYAAMKDDPRRWWTGVFQTDAECKDELLKKKTYDSCQRFVVAMAKRDWDLVGGVHVYGPFKLHDIDTSVVILGKSEWKVRAIFRLAQSLKSIRMEVPSGLVRRDPEQRLTLREALRARA